MKAFISNILLLSLLLINNNIRVNCKPTLNSDASGLSSDNYDYYHNVAKDEISLEKEEAYLDLDLNLNATVENDGRTLVKKSTTGLQSVKFIKYEESLSEVANPYRGFYKQAYVFIKRNKGSYIDYIPSTSLVRALIDISDFQSKSFDEEAISFLNRFFETLKKNRQTAVVRFSYHKGFDKKYKTTEPNIDRVLIHLDQIKNIFKTYDDVIASVECGLFGYYGEMYESNVESVQKMKIEFINKTIKKWLEILPKSITLTVRTIKQYIDYNKDVLKVSISDISKHKPSSSDPGYRIGIFNDAYFASANDIGTYNNRTKEVAWLSNQATHTLFGGEFGITNDKPNGQQISTEAFKTHTSYLNAGFYEATIENLQKRVCSSFFGNYEGQKEYKYIENHLGYRYVVSKVLLTTEAESNGMFGAEISIKNVGFGNLIKPKSLYVIMTDKNNKIYYLTDSLRISNKNPCQWWSKETAVVNIEGILPSNMPNGKYKLYLRIASNRNGGLNGYPIRFANNDKNIWNESLGANYLGEFSIVGTNKGGNKTNPPKDPEINPSKPISTTEPFNSKYATIKFKGMLDNTDNFYLGVPELKEYENFNIYELTDTTSAKYRTWHVDSESKPSLLYLSNGSFGNIGEPSEYCLDLGTYTNSNGYNFLSIVKCSIAKHKFMYGKSYSNSIDVYDLNGNHLVDSNKNNLCLYYSMTPRVDKCSISGSKKNMSWKKSNLSLEFTTVKYKGMLPNANSNQYLGVQELKEYKNFNIKEENDTTSAKYRTWHIYSESSPSLLYLSNATYGNNGKPSNYCLDLGTYLSDQGYNYLSVVECSKAQHKFMYGESFTNSIDVYKKNGDHLKDNNGNLLCLYYSMTPRVDKCTNKENMQWAKYILTDNQ